MLFWFSEFVIEWLSNHPHDDDDDDDVILWISCLWNPLAVTLIVLQVYKADM